MSELIASDSQVVGLIQRGLWNPLARVSHLPLLAAVVDLLVSILQRFAPE